MRLACLLLFALPAAAAFGANTADFRRSENIDDRREESSQDSYADSMSRLELSRKNLIAIGKAVGGSSSHLAERCKNLKEVAPDLEAIGKAAEKAGPVSDALPADGGTAIAGIFSAADLSGVDPCTGAAKVESGMLGKGAEVLTKKSQMFGDRFAPVILRVNIGGALLERASANAESECRQWASKVGLHLAKFRDSYVAISSQLNASRSDLLYQAQKASGRSCAKAQP